MIAKASEVRFFGVAWIIRDKGIESDDGVIASQKVLAQMRTDKAGGAGDETFHAWFLP